MEDSHRVHIFLHLDCILRAHDKSLPLTGAVNHNFKAAGVLSRSNSTWNPWTVGGRGRGQTYPRVSVLHDFWKQRFCKRLLLLYPDLSTGNVDWRLYSACRGHFISATKGPGLPFDFAFLQVPRFPFFPVYIINTLSCKQSEALSDPNRIQSEPEGQCHKHFTERETKLDRTLVQTSGFLVCFQEHSSICRDVKVSNACLLCK